MVLEGPKFKYLATKCAYLVYRMTKYAPQSSIFVNGFEYDRDI